METRRQREEKRYNKIRSKPVIGYNISQFLSQTSDRSQLAESKNKGLGRRRYPYEGFLVHPDDKDKICIPSGDVFRTHPDPEEGCAPFTVAEQGGTCCVQTDLVFCAAVAAIIRGREEDVDDFFPREIPRIPNEIYMWLSERKPQLLLPDHEVRVDTSTSDGRQLIDFAISMSTDTPIRLELHQPNQILPENISHLRGRVTVDVGGTGVGSLNFTSLRDIVQNGSTLRNLSIDCAVDIPAAQDEHHVAAMIYNFQSWESAINFQFSFPLPQRIPVQSVGQVLAGFNGWSARPGPEEGPIREHEDGEQTSTTFDLARNRIIVLSRIV